MEKLKKQNKTKIINQLMYLFYRKIALRPSSYEAKMFLTKMLTAEMSMAEMRRKYQTWPERIQIYKALNLVLGT